VAFRFIDLFAGIGGIRTAAEINGGQCVFSSEINESAAATYQLNYGEKPVGDITKVNESDIPSHDVLFAGFPCQPFSICGFKKGFEDTRGTLFFHIMRIARYHKTKCLILENVKHLKDHDGGDTMNVIINTLVESGYHVSYSILNAVNFGLPQNRERTIVVASLDKSFNFDNLIQNKSMSMASILEKDAEFEYLNANDYTLLSDDVIKRQPLSGLRFVGYRNRNLRKVGVREGTEHLSRVHKQPNRIYCSSGTHPTLAAGESSGRYWIFIDGKVRKLTMKECYRLQGFGDNFIIHQNPTAAYKQIGNSVPVPMIAEVVRSAVEQRLIGGRS
jgi:DNA (cytosine-5)-methyltransferase 1